MDDTRPPKERTNSHSAASVLTGLALVAGLVALPNTAAFAGASNIDTYTGTALSGVYSQGPNNVATFGQTITAPLASDHYLTSFTFYVWGNNADYKNLAQVYAYNSVTKSTVGGALFTSGPFTITTSGNNVYNPYLIDTSAGGGISLSAGSQYVVLFTSIGAGNPDGAQGLGNFAFGYIPLNPYAGGNFVSRDDYSGTAGIYRPGTVIDLAFKATFGTGPSAVTATPEPGAMVTGLSMAGMTGIGLLRGRRRHSRT